MSDKLYYLDALAEILETAIYTMVVKDENPSSLIFVGPSGAGKTKLLKRYDEPYIHITDSITSNGLFDISKKDQANRKKFILLPDINPTLSRRSATMTATIANLLSVTSDGTVRTDDGRGEKICKHSPMGLLTGCTPEIYEKNAKAWFALGLRRRIIPIFYQYTMETEAALQSHVRNGKIHSQPLEIKKLKMPAMNRRPAISENISLQIENLSEKLAGNLGKLSFLEKQIRKWYVKDIVPVSPHVYLRTMAMAHAIRANSSVVRQKEVEFLISLVSFTDAESPKQI